MKMIGKFSASLQCDTNIQNESKRIKSTSLARTHSVLNLGYLNSVEEG